MATLPTLPTEYFIPTLDMSFPLASWNPYVFDGAATPANLRDFLRGNNVSPWGTLDRSSKNAVIHLDPAIDWVLSGGNTDYFFVDDGEDQDNWLVITTLAANLSSLPVRGERVRPSDHSSAMPKLRTTFINTPVVGIDLSCAKVRFLGVEITRNTNSNANSIFMTSRNLGITQASTVAEQSQDVIIDRCCVHAHTDDLTVECRGGIELNTNGGAVVDSVVYGFRSGTSDATAIHSWMGDNHHVENNELVASGMSYFAGGVQTIVNEEPTNVTITRNWCYKPESWDPNSSEYGGVSWTIKNFIEFKMGQLINIQGNVCDNSWVSGQQTAIAFKSSSQPVNRTDLVINGSDSTKVTSAATPFVASDIGSNIRITAGTGFNTGFFGIVDVVGAVAELDASAGTVGSTGGSFTKGLTPWISLNDVTFTNNFITRCVDGITIVPSENNLVTQKCTRWLIENNFIQSNLNGTKRIFLWGGADNIGDVLSHLTIKHNTMIFGDYGDVVGNGVFVIATSAPPGTNADEIDIRDNIFNHGTFGIFRTSTAVGTASADATWTNYTWTNNLLYDGNTSNNKASNYTGGVTSWHENAAADVGFQEATGKQFRLGSAGTGGDYRAGGDRDASDGTDLGVDWDALQSAIKGVVQGKSPELLPAKFIKA